jgi:predicted choloylglycine hydrolase
MITMEKTTRLDFDFRALRADQAGQVWKTEFERFWPAYRSWFLRYGERDRPTYFESLQAIKRFMPRFLPVYESLVDLAGGGDHAARFLSQYCPPPLFKGCSQAVYIEDEPVIVRNYDYSPFVFDGLCLHSQFAERAVIGMIDCMSGVLDGMNEDGLAVSMSFGGREEFGNGFGIAILMSYLLEFAGSVAEAEAMITDIPVHGAYNIMLVDRDSHFSTIEVRPDTPALITRDAVSTNHQRGSSWPIYEEKVQTSLRREHLDQLVQRHDDTVDSFTGHFLQPPLFNDQYARGFGTLYSAAYFPRRGECRIIWPGHSWSFDFDNFHNKEYSAKFVDPRGYPVVGKRYAEVYTSQHIPVIMN